MHDQPLLIITVGSPGSGKSYYAAQIAADIRAAHVRSDDFRDWLFSEPTYDADEDRHLFHFINHLVEKLLSTGVSVIYDANFNLRQHRDDARAKAERFGARFSLVHVDTPLEVAIERAAHRAEHQIGREVVEQLHNEIEDFSQEHVVRIDGMHAYEVQRIEILSKLTGQ